jgi:hypothetical protein
MTEDSIQDQGRGGGPEETEMEEGQGRRIEDLVWKCLTCGTTAPPTNRNYMSMIQHPCTGKRQIWLVDKNTGEQLANNANKAAQLGYIPKQDPPKLTVPVEEAGGEKEELASPEVSNEGILRYTMSLPADAFALYNLAKASGLEKDGGKLFDEWVWDCILARFRTDYKMQLVLAPIAEAPAA